MKKRFSGLVGSPLAAMKERMRLDTELRRYFYTDSRFSDALRKHIQDFKDLIVDLPYDDCQLVYPRGQGPVSIGKTECYGVNYDKDSKPVESKVFSMEFTVLFWSDEVGEELKRSYSINAPITLIDDECDDEEFKLLFDEWINVTRMERAVKKKKEDMKLLKNLVETYPEEIRKLGQMAVWNGEF